MNFKLVTAAMLIGLNSHAQSIVQTVNSGSLIALGSTASVGEIVVNPDGAGQSSSGIIGILVQINGQTLETTSFVLSANVTVYPNPTVAKIYFSLSETLSGKSISVIDSLGKIVLQTKISNDNSIDLQTLSAGVFAIQFDDKTSKTFKIIKH